MTMRLRDTLENSARTTPSGNIIGGRVSDHLLKLTFRVVASVSSSRLIVPHLALLISLRRGPLALGRL
jgi:hypothetical protein